MKIHHALTIIFFIIFIFIWAFSKNGFSPSGLSQWSKNKGTLGPLGPSPGSATVPSGSL